MPPEKQERVLAAAIAEFSQRNVEQANISNIVRQAGISRGSFYQYFDSKDDLYVYMFETLRHRRSEYTQPAFKYYKTHPFLEFFEHFYLLDSQFLLRHPLHIELGKIMYSHAHGVSLGLIEAVQRRYCDIFLIAIAHDQDAGRIRADIDTRLLADLCTHFMTDIFIFQNFQRRMSLTEVEEHLHGTIGIIRHGIE
ncbi:MAG: TetR/AcrR family transcriptional regulator [Propionibacteriaceae bacterium]|nr:TetR/AcrR family transcriptional regulator [Propionibacteriaceae bacterium]